MKKLFIFLSAVFSVFIGFSFAANPSILNPSYNIEGDEIKIFRTNNSDGGSIDINVFNPTSQERLRFGTAKISDQVFAYTKQRDGEQKIWMIPNDGGDEVKIVIPGTNTVDDNATISATTRTVIPAVPKTGPSINVIGIIIATFVIFGGYIYIKRKADI